MNCSCGRPTIKRAAGPWCTYCHKTVSGPAAPHAPKASSALPTQDAERHQRALALRRARRAAWSPEQRAKAQAYQAAYEQAHRARLAPRRLALQRARRPGHTRPTAEHCRPVQRGDVTYYRRLPRPRRTAVCDVCGVALAYMGGPYPSRCRQHHAIPSRAADYLHPDDAS